MKAQAMMSAMIAGAVMCTAVPAMAQTTQPAQKPVAAAPAPAPAPAPAAPAAKEEPGIPFCLARGLCNVSTGWLELPRCMVYDNALIPFFGLIVGIPEGAGFTVARTICGVMDIISFGTMGSTCHGKVFPDIVFQSKWMPPKK